MANIQVTSWLLAGTIVKNSRILMEKSFTVHMPWQTATSIFRLERRCYSYHLHEPPHHMNM